MNFFEAQDNARRKTGQLAVMFGAAVLTLVLLTNLLIAVVFMWGSSSTELTFTENLASIPADAWAWISLGVIGVIAVATAYKFLSLRGGGRTIAEALGGHLIPQTTQVNDQRRLLNIVEEMAIASGVPIPPVYLIPEASINAFAAGFSPDDAVIGINQGTLDNLNRAELQGVVAHEFSHILNGDTKINLRLIAILHGILFIGMIGYGLLRAGGYSRRNGLPLLAVGAGLLVIGYGGTFFGNMIKSAVSRQREYLADASAVQFTREPAGIANALKKIGGLPLGSNMESKEAEQASHMFFGSAARKFSGLFATHPPLEDRIKAIEPGWNGAFPEIPVGMTWDTDDAPVANLSTSSGTAHTHSLGDQVVAQVGTPTPETLAHARQLIAESPEMLKAAAHNPHDARALVYGTLLAPTEPADLRNQQLRVLHEHADHGVVDTLVNIIDAIDQTDAEHRITLVEMAVPALKELSHPQYKRFSDNVNRLITSDGRVEIFEWMLHRTLTKELKAHFESAEIPHGRIKDVLKLEDDVQLLLSVLASHASSDVKVQIDSYQAGAAELGLKAAFKKQEYFDYQRMNSALGSLRKLRVLSKPKLLKACAQTIASDNKVTADERALLHGIAATLDCPLPPLT